MAPPLLALQNIALSFGGAALLVDADISVAPGDRLALVGRNGSGKSTLLKIAAGLIHHDAGKRFLQPGATLQYLAQEPDFSGYKTTIDYVNAGLGPSDDTFRATWLLNQLGLSGAETVANLSGGEARRAALARALAPAPDVLLLDEPTNHLDLPAIEWLEVELSGLRSAMVLISHDRAFLNRLSQKTIWLDRGRAHQLNKGFSSFEKWRDQFLEEEAQAQHKLDRKIVAEEHWLRYGVTARRKRNVRRLGQLHQLREQRVNDQRPGLEMNISVAAGKTTGSIIIDAKSISKNIGGRQLVNDFSLRVMRGDRLAIIGPNGAGKTTLVNLLVGNLPPDSGEVKPGSNIELALLDQTRTSLDPNTSLKDALTGGGKDFVLINGAQKHVIAYMKDFLFTPDQISTPLRTLSGGERARVMLARALALPSNLLVLDEPTNDLDMETLDLLQETIANYDGTVILVSHDRDFIDRVASLTLIGTGDGVWTCYAGGYSDMLALRGFGVTPPEKNLTPDKKKPTRARPVASESQQRKKLSFKHSHALKTLPGQMAELEKTIAGLDKKLAEEGFYQRDPEGFARAGREHEAAQRQKDILESQWLELEILREEIEGN
ncbi:Bis-ABC ATPase Uup [hydrothermal vent metagenome]|uniref:Bis-ABC ATPase Uup n=1 Tax=hydrothermal vent metagenome TaxID=652676 RepID=A0A3B0TV22_9ZZZZ